MNEVQCFILEPTKRVRLWLRRFQFSNVRLCVPNVPFSYCNAMVDFGEHDARIREDGYLDGFEDLSPERDDPRWPTVCEKCGRPFDPADQFQVFQKQLYRRVDTGEIYTVEDAPPGAMWDASWMGEHARCPDGKNWIIKLPNGCDWMPGGPSRNADGSSGSPWTITGTAPNLTATPSVWVRQGMPDDWHGFLTNGVLRKC